MFVLNYQRISRLKKKETLKIRRSKRTIYEKMNSGEHLLSNPHPSALYQKWISKLEHLSLLLCHCHYYLLSPSILTTTFLAPSCHSFTPKIARLVHHHSNSLSLHPSFSIFGGDTRWRHRPATKTPFLPVLQSATGGGVQKVPEPREHHFSCWSRG